MTKFGERVVQILPGKRWAQGALVAAVAAVSAGVCPAVAAEESVENFAKRLANLRSEVEGLSSELSALTADSRDELRALARQKSNLDLELEKEQMRLRKLELSASEKKKEIAADEQNDDSLKPVFERNLLAVEQYVRSALPFRKEERLQALDKLRSQLASGELSAPRAVARLWSFVEDELRLSRESGLYRQTIRIDGVEQLAEVIRVGTVMLLFKANDDVSGYAVRKGDGYDFVAVSDTKVRKQIDSVFVSFKKQIRAGYFTLPNAVLNPLTAQTAGAQ